MDGARANQLDYFAPQKFLLSVRGRQGTFLPNGATADSKSPSKSGRERDSALMKLPKVVLKEGMGVDGAYGLAALGCWSM